MRIAPESERGRATEWHAREQNIVEAEELARGYRIGGVTSVESGRIGTLDVPASLTVGGMTARGRGKEKR